MDYLTNDTLLGDFLSPLNQSCLVAEDGLGLLDECLEVAGHLRSHGFSSLKAKDVLSEWLPVDSLLHATGSNEEDAFCGMDWMVEKMDLKGFDFDSLLGTEDMEATVSPDDLLAVLEDSCDLLGEPPFPVVLDNLPVPDLFTYCPKSPFGGDQVAPITHIFSPALSPECLDSSPISEFPPECMALPLSPKRETSTPEPCILYPSQEPLSSTLNHSLSLELGSEVDIAVRDITPVCFVWQVLPKGEVEEEAVSDDSGIGLSPDSYLASPEQSPGLSAESPPGVEESPASYLEIPKQSPVSGETSPSSQLPPESPISVRPKPYDPPTEDKVLARVKVAGGERKLDKKTKKMEQNKTAATRYRQKKRAEQEAISAECRELEGKNDALQERVDSLAKEIQYLKGLIEEVREAKSRRAKSQSAE